jgi:hypothetical protein
MRVWHFEGIGHRYNGAGVLVAAESGDQALLYVQKKYKGEYYFPLPPDEVDVVAERSGILHIFEWSE